MSWTQQDTSFKKLQSKRITTSTGKGINEEKGASTLELYLPDIKTELIPGTPPGASTSVLSYTGGTGQTLAVDTSVPSNLTWFATSGYGNTTLANDGSQSSEEARLMSWISDKYDAFGTISGAGYEVKLYDKNSNLITKTDPSDWLFDYQTGILTFNNASTAYGTVATSGPYRIVGYRYIGSKGIISASYGGLGYTTYTKGDLLVGAGSTFIKLNVGSNNYVLSADSSTPSGLNWVVNSGSGGGSGITGLNGLTATTQFFAVGSSGTEFNISSSGSTHTFNIPIAGTGSTGLISTLAQTIAGSKTFTSAIIGDLSGTATTSTYAYQSGYAITSGIATTSNYAYQSGYAVTSGLATTSEYSYQSGYAITSGLATTATYAYQSGYGITAGFATTAGLATTSTYSYQSGYAVTSGFATTASYAYQSGYGITAGLATTATYAYQSGYAITAGIANSSYSSFINASSANLSHPLVFTPITGSSSGAGLSLNTVLNYNPSSNILYTSGLAVTATTVSTSTSNGALQVAGGVGISGKLFFNQASFGTTGISSNPTIAMIGSTGDPIFMSVLEDNTISFEGSQGQLFSITPNLSTGYIYSVNDITGIPLFRANANANVTANEYAGNFGIGLSNPGYKLHVVGSVGFTSNISSTSTTSGTLVVSGGVGIGGSLYVSSATAISGVTINNGVITGNLTGTATTATTSGFASTASYAYQSGYGLTSGLATTANYAHESGYAITSGSSAFATTANYSYQSGYGITSGFATTAGLATTANYAHQSGYAVTSGLATTATYSHQSGYAITSGLATTASYAHQSGYAITSGFATSSTSASIATTSTNINVVSATTSASHPVLFTPVSGTASGAALSTESSFVYNPSTDILSVSGLAVTSGTASTNATTGALVVTGGVGIGGSLFVGGDLTINGTTTTINSVTLTVDDKNIELGSVSSPSDVTAEGGGITLKGATDKFINWYTGTGWSSSESLNLASGNAYKINNTAVLSASSLGTGVTNSSLTALGTITTGVWTGTTITGLYGGTGYTTYTKGDLLVGAGSTFIKLAVGSDNFVLTASSLSATGLTWSPTSATGITSLNGLSSSIQYFSIGYSGTDPSFSSSGSTHTLNIPIAGTGVTGLITGITQTIAGQKTFTSAIIGDLTGTATTAGFATTANYSLQSGYAITSGLATTATYAYQSGYAITAGLATTATYSHQSGYAITAGSSGLATTATYAHQSGYAITAGLATTATYSYQSGYGLTSGLATTATYAHQSGYAITSGFATTSANINVVNAVTNSAHPLHFSPVATGSGVAVSSNTAFSFNPSTLILSTSGLAVTTSTVSTSSSTGALVVTGGVGIGGSVYTATDLNVGNSTTGRLYFSQATLGSAGTTVIPSMAFIGSTNSPITLSVLADNSLSFDGSSGQLFSINNNLSTGYIFAVNDISGLPLLRANADGTVTMGEFAGNIGIGLSNPSYKLHVAGDTNLSSGYVYRINGTSVLSASSLGTGVTNSSLTALGTITTGTWAGSTITGLYGGTGYTNYTPGDILVGAGGTFVKLNSGSTNYVLTSNGSGTVPSWQAVPSSAASSVAVSPTAANSSFSITAVNSASGTGLGLSTIASFVINPSTGIVSMSGLAVTALTASTSTSTGALVVSGGVGIGGSLYVSSATAISGVTINAGVITGDLTGTATTASYSYQSGYATTAGSATTSDYSYQSGYGITAGFATTAGLATTASYAYQSGYGITSGLATTASNLNVVNASSGTFYPVLSNTASTTSGIGASVNSLFSFNASTGAFGATSVNLFAGQSYSIGGNSVLSATSLGTGVTNSSLTALGTVTTGTWSGSIISGLYGGTGYTSYSKGDILVGAGSTFIKLNVGTDNFVLTADNTTATGVKWSSVAGLSITSVNGLTASAQFFSTGVSGTGFNISSSGSTHTFNIPIAGTGSTGLVSTQSQSFAGIKTFTNAVSITDTTGSSTYTSGALVVTGGVGIGGTLNVQGDLNIQGTFTTINSTTVNVADKNIELGVVATPTDITAQGGGITLRGATDKSINWYSGVGWSSSESWNLASGNTYKIGGTTVLSATSLGTGVTNSSLTALGTVSTGVWAATAITALYGGTGLVPTFTVGDILYANTENTWERLAASSNSGYLLASAGSGATPTYVAPSTLSVGFATTSNYSYQSGYAITSGSATSAGLATTATYAHQSGYAITSGSSATATTATYAHQSGYAITSGIATTANYAYQSGYAITSGLATTATYAHQSGYAITSGSSALATTATYAHQSGYAITSGLATTASNINLVNVSSGTFYPILSNTSLSVNGIGASVNSFFSFNASTGAFGATSVNILAGQSYIIGGNSVLSATSLGTGVTNSSLTALGTITTGTWAGSLITGLYGGTGYNSYSKGDILVGAGSTFIKVGSGSTNYILSSSSIYPAGVGWTWVSAVGVGTNPPNDTHDSDLWWNSDDGSLNFYYNDGDTSQWVEIAGGSGIDLSQPVHITSGAASTNTVTGALIVDGGVGIGGLLNATSVRVNGGFDLLDSSLVTSTSSANQVGFAVSSAEYRTLKFIVSVDSGSDYQSDEILMMHNGSTVFMTEYAQLLSGSGTTITTYDGDISSGNLRLLVSPLNSVTNYSISCIGLRV